MRRIERVNNIFEANLYMNYCGRRKKLSITKEDVVENGCCNKDNKTYKYIAFENGLYLYYRHTEKCTFYEATFGRSENYSLYMATEKKIEKEVEKGMEINNETNLFELERVEVNEFYNKEFNTYYEIENEKTNCFGFGVNGGETIYIPTGTVDKNIENCIIINKEDVEDFIKNTVKFDGMLANLKRENNKIKEMSFKLSMVNLDYTITMDKMTSDKVVEIKTEYGIAVKGYVLEDRVYIPRKYENPLFSFSTLEILDLNDVVIARTVYEKYKSTKKTRGVSDEIKADLFSFFKY